MILRRGMRSSALRASGPVLRYLSASFSDMGYWPVPGTMMVEPTESESKAELDRFCEALISIHAEITAIQSGQADKQNNLLKHAPHTADMLAAERWDHPYSRGQACFPAQWLREHKFWPAVGRIDNVFGDRNLVCSCAGMEAYSD